MFNNKEDVYKGYSSQEPKPLQDPPEAEAKFTETAQRVSQPEPQPPYAQQPYAQSPQQPYVQPAQQAPYGQPPYTQPAQQTPYGQQPFAQPTQQAPYGQTPYAPIQPNPYGQPAYPYTGAQPPKKKSAGKIIAIVIACIVGINLLFFGVIVGVFMAQSPEKKVEAYEQSGNLSDLIDACDRYDNQVFDIDDPVAAEKHFDTALRDTKAFMRAFKDAECADYYEDDSAAYNTLMTDWLCLMLINGDYEKYADVFVEKMQEISPSGNYYMDTYTLMHYIESDYIVLTEPQKQAALSAFDRLIAASRNEEERQMNLSEYYDFCETLGEYDKADQIEQQIDDTANAA